MKPTVGWINSSSLRQQLRGLLHSSGSELAVTLHLVPVASGERLVWMNHIALLHQSCYRFICAGVFADRCSCQNRSSKTHRFLATHDVQPASGQGRAQSQAKCRARTPTGGINIREVADRFGEAISDHREFAGQAFEDALI